METDYHKIVDRAEEGLLPCAKRSFEAGSRKFVDGQEVFKHFADLWQDGDQDLIKQRTPIQIQRDRILYSYGMRKQTEKYHILYNGQHRIVRSYATHAMKMAQVTRAICRGLYLNEDFGEAIALGAKVGAVPFIHAAKKIAGSWAFQKVKTLDSQWSTNEPIENKGQLELEFRNKEIPSFVSDLQSEKALRELQKFMPWAAGRQDSSLYGSGSESYWLLCMNPFTAQVKQNQYFPETMYGIWRHTRGLWPSADSFHHRFRLQESRGVNEITNEHATFEAIAVQYADDITWVIENLNDANSVALLNEQGGIYSELTAELGANLPARLQKALSENDAGGIYSFFISDFIENSTGVFKNNQGQMELRNELATGNLRIGLSDEADNILERMISFLEDYVFQENRTRNRLEMLRSITGACLDLIFNDEEVLRGVIEDQYRLRRLNRSQKSTAIKLLNNEIHKTQLSMDVLASWGDQEIYDFVGIQSL